MHTIAILWLRQIKRYTRSRARLLGSLGQPILLLLALGFGFGPIYAKAGGGNYLEFLAPGVIAMGVLFTGVFSGIEIIWDRQFGFLRETLVAPVPRLHIMIGRTLGGATVAVIQGVIIFAITLVAGFRPDPAMLPVALLAMFLIAVLFTAFGTAIACVLEDFQAFQLIMNFIIMPLFFLSGALFPLQEVPLALQVAARLDPLSYGVDALRFALLGASHFGFALDMTVLTVCCAVMLAVGARLFQRIEV